MDVWSDLAVVDEAVPLVVAREGVAKSFTFDNQTGVRIPLRAAHPYLAEWRGSMTGVEGAEDAGGGEKRRRGCDD